MSEQLVQKNVTASRAKRFSYPKAGKAEIEVSEIPEINAENLLLKTLYSGISRGTESLVFHGNVPESEWDNMRCPNMKGSFEFPVTYGYACVCEIIAKGAHAEQFEIGDRVFVLHPHQDVIEIHPSACNQLPDQLNSDRAVLTANMETALNAVWDAEIEDQPSCAVIGAGVVGLLTAHALRQIAGIEPLVIDIEPEKQTIASKLGLQFSNVEHFSDCGRKEFDLLFHTSASASGLQFALDHAAFEAKIIEMSWYGNKPVTLNLGSAFHCKRLKIISSQVGSIAPAKRNAVNYASRMQEAMQLLLDERLDNLLEPAIAFHELPNHVHEIFSPQSNALCQLIEYTG